MPSSGCSALHGVNPNLKKMFKIRNYANPKIVWSIFEPHLNYSSIVWATSGSINTILSFKKKALKIISFKPEESDLVG